jgi:hypothetical protein
MASDCPPTGAGRYICETVKWPNLGGPSSPGLGQVVHGAVGDLTDSALHGIASAAASAADGLVKTLSTMWMNVNTPGLSSAAAIQKDTRWITAIVAVVSILVAAGQLALRRRGEPASTMAIGLTRVVVTGAAATFLVQTAGSLADTFSSDMMGSTVAHLGSNGWSGIVSTTLISSAIAPGDVMTVIIALLIIISSLIQLMLMILRVGLLVILTGTLPLVAAASMSDWGQTWWRKHVGWLAAWLLYKPAAALLYVSAFTLTQGKSLVQVLAGFMILILSVLILPALLRVIVPMTANLGAASGGGLAMAAAGALATGAVRAGLHKPPALAQKKDSSAPDADSGPSGAGATPAEGSPGTPPPPSSDDKAPHSNSSRLEKAATFAAGAAAGLSGGSSWRRSREDPAGDGGQASDEKRTPKPAKPQPQEDSGPHGAADQGDDEPRENGG